MKLCALLAICLAVSLAFGSGECRASKVMLLSDGFAKSSHRFYTQLKDGIRGAGYSVREIEGAQLAQALAAANGPGMILVLPNARYFPAEAKSALETFLKRKNHLLAVSGPPLGRLVVRSDEGWLTKELAKVTLTHARGEKIADFAEHDAADWQRVSGAGQNRTEYGVEPSGDPEVPDALHVEISRLDNWDTIVSKPMEKPFPEGYTATVFWAKGGPETPELVVEWREKDGCRWMAVVKLTTEWVRYALVPADFNYWPDNPAVGRGGLTDRFKPENARIISFGLANGISEQKLGIPHSFWVSDVRAVKDEHADVDFTPPFLESISPSYKTYKTTASELELLPEGQRIPAAAGVISAIPRGRGFGCDGPRASRFIPVLRALENGELRGTAAHLYLNASNDYAGSVWGFVGFDQQFLERAADQTVPLVVSMLQRMGRGLFLLNAGAQHTAYEDGETVNTGAYVVNIGQAARSPSARFSLFAGGRQMQSWTADVPEDAFDEENIVFIPGRRLSLEPGEYTLKTELLADGQPIDEISHEFRVIEFGEPSAAETVTVRDGDFYLGGEKWYPLGMNYWPRYSIGQESPDWGRWTSPEQYDPELVEQDLALAQKLGMNALSVQYGRIEHARPLMDFLARAQKHGIKVHIYMPGLHPLNYDFELATSLIDAAHLPQSSAFFAYDVGWEVHVGPYERRRPFDKLWQEWVIDQYGSVQSAEKDWDFTPERVDGVITGPSDAQLRDDGDWRVYVAAYRRFWDDEISRRYRIVRTFIKSVDQRHLICARSGFGGTGSAWAVPQFPFDLASGAKHLDFTSPEGYGLSGDRLGFLKGGLTTVYGRFVSGGKPVFWVEYGMSVWPQCGPEALARQREYYENMLQMTYDSHASGSVGWWWPGGFRVNEISDYGIVNSDGTPRPAALEIGRFAERLTAPRDIPAPDHFIAIDRDKHVSGYAGVFAEHRDEYVEAVESGKTPAVKSEATGTTSANVPLIAVGNVPYNGSNPPKYLNAEFNYIRVNGQSVSDGDSVEVERGKPVCFEASAGNTQEAKWLAPAGAGKGAVWLKASVQTASGVSEARGAIDADTPFLADAKVAKTLLAPRIDGEATCTFRMIAADRAEFGEVVRVTLKAR